MTTDKDPVTLVLAPDHELVQSGLARMLEPYGDRVRLLPPGELADITLVDPQVDPDGSALGRALADPDQPRVVVFAWDLEPAAVGRAIARGATGYLAKSLGAQELVDALVAIRAGRMVVAGVGSWSAVARDAAGLTKRESEVLTLITAGHSNEEIAAMLFVSINSVKSYIRSAYRKIRVGSRSRAVLWGVEHGLLLPDGDADPPAESDDPPGA